MTDAHSRLLPLLLLGSVLAVLAGVVGYAVFASGKLPEGPAQVVWDKAPCAACGMHVGEPSFAAQLTTKSGKTLAFDDPGCLFLFVERNRPDVHGLWFHHCREDRWIAGDEVAFVTAEHTPMGFGLAAVDKGEPAAIDYDAARRRVLLKADNHRER